GVITGRIAGIDTDDFSQQVRSGAGGGRRKRGGAEYRQDDEETIESPHGILFHPFILATAFSTLATSLYRPDSAHSRRRRLRSGLRAELPRGWPRAKPPGS